MSMQILTDFGWSHHGWEYSEDDYVVAGPGAVIGAKHVFPHLTPVQAIHQVQASLGFEEHGPIPEIDPPSGRLRTPVLWICRTPSVSSVST